MIVDRDPNDLARNQEEWRRRQALDNELQADPELVEGPAGSGRIALFAIAALAILGVVLYGLNSTTPTDTATNPPSQTTASGSTAPGKMSPTTHPDIHGLRRHRFHHFVNLFPLGDAGRVETFRSGFRISHKTADHLGQVRLARKKPLTAANQHHVLPAGVAGAARSRDALDSLIEIEK